MKYSQKIKGIIEELLKEDPRCRNNDKWLTICVLRKLGINFFIDYRDLEKIPEFDTIPRCRRHIQHKENKYNEEEFIPEEGVTYDTQEGKQKCQEIKQQNG